VVWSSRQTASRIASFVAMERGRPAQGSAGCADISTAADVEDFVIATKKLRRWTTAIE